MPLLMDTTASHQRRKTLILLVWCLLLMLAWGLWLWHLDASDLTFDEAATYFVAHRPLLEILEYLRGAVREHPPVYYLLIHGWMALAGTSEFSLRFFSVGAGLVALALTGWLARLTVSLTLRHSHTLTPPLMGLVATALLAVVPGMAYYARDARMYSLGIVWTVLSAGLFLRDWLPTRKMGDWPRRAALISLVTVNCLALFTHYYLLLPILVQPFVLLITRRWRPFLAWCAAHSLPALVGLAWLWLAPGLQMTIGDLQLLTLVVPAHFQVFHLLGKILFSPVVRVRFHLLYWLLALVGGGVLLALWRRRVTGVWLALALMAPLALAYVLPQPPAPRYLVFLIPLAALALGYLCVAPLYLTPPRPHTPIPLLAWGATFGLVFVGARLLTAGGLYQAITFDRSHYGYTLKTVQAYARPGDGVLFYGPWQWIQFRYYDPGGLPPITTLPPYAPPHLQPNEAEPVLEELLAQYGRLWVVPSAVDDVDPAHFAEGWLRAHAHAVWETDDFSLYLPPLPPDTPTRSLGLTFGPALHLERVAYEPQPVPAGEPLRLTLYWSPLHYLDDDVRLALALADQTGHVWDAAYSLPGAWVSPPSTWQPRQVITDYEGLMVPQGAAPGEYVVRLMVNDGATGEPLLVEGDKEIDLLTVQVAEPARAPVLHSLPHPNAATFCSPDEATCLTLAGYEPGGLRFQQGYPVPLTLHWLSPSRSLPELELRLQILHSPFSILHSPLSILRPPSSILTRTLPLASSYPASLWTPGRLVTLPTALTLPPDAPTGPAHVTLEVLGPDGNPWPMAGGDKSFLSIPERDQGRGSTFPLFNITVEARPVLRKLPARLTLIQADFGPPLQNEVGLRGYRVEGDPRPGGQLHLTYAWYARARPTAIYAVFNHLVTADGALVAQADGWPQGGRMLTTQWQAGEYIEDSYTLAIPSDAPPGPYTLYVGLYDAATYERQPAFQDNQRLPEDRVPIPLPGEDGR